MVQSEKWSSPRNRKMVQPKEQKEKNLKENKKGIKPTKTPFNIHDTQHETKRYCPTSIIIKRYENTPKQYTDFSSVVKLENFQ